MFSFSLPFCTLVDFRASDKRASLITFMTYKTAACVPEIVYGVHYHMYLTNCPCCLYMWFAPLRVSQHPRLCVYYGVRSVPPLPNSGIAVGSLSFFLAVDRL